jgi:hypothetical protein
MSATTVIVDATEIFPQAGSNLNGWKLGWVNSGAKAAQNDIWTVSNAKEVIAAWITLDATGAAETHTISGASITLTGATGTACSGLILYR